MLRRWTAALLLILVLLVPLILHRNSWQGYFESDDLSNISWACLVQPTGFLLDILPRQWPFEPARAVGGLYYSVLIRTAVLNFPPWLFVLQAFGCLNIILLWLLLRRLGFPTHATALACLFFGASRTLLDAWWKPMFIFDVVCTTFVLICLLCYLRRYWILSFLAFWLAIRSKEIAVVIPAMLFVLEFTVGNRKWRRVLPFLIPALVYGGLGAWWGRTHEKEDYRISFQPSALWHTFSFYSWRLLGFSATALFLPLLFPARRDRRLALGLGLAICGAAIYLALPNRLLEVYLYLAMTGIAVALAAAVTHSRYPRGIAVVFLVWLAWQSRLINRQARIELAAASERRAYVDALRHVPQASGYLYADLPASMRHWGVEGALLYFYPKTESILPLEQLRAGRPSTLLDWDPTSRRISASPFVAAQFQFFPKFAAFAPWQTAAKWDLDPDGFRLIPRLRSVRAYYPRGAGFTWEACGPADSELRTFVDGVELTKLVFHEPGCAQRQQPLTGIAVPIVMIDFLPHPEGRILRVGDFGFQPALSPDR